MVKTSIKAIVSLLKINGSAYGMETLEKDLVSTVFFVYICARFEKRTAFTLIK